MGCHQRQSPTNYKYPREGSALIRNCDRPRRSSPFGMLDFADAQLDRGLRLVITDMLQDIARKRALVLRLLCLSDNGLQSHRKLSDRSGEQ
jgi:hypothetical protein